RARLKPKQRAALAQANRLTAEALRLYGQGKAGQAIGLLLRALPLRKEVQGEKHPHYGTTLHILALLYKDTGKFGLALPLYQQALRLHREVLGVKHPDYARGLNNLAVLFASLRLCVRTLLVSSRRQGRLNHAFQAFPEGAHHSYRAGGQLAAGV